MLKGGGLCVLLDGRGIVACGCIGLRRQAVGSHAAQCRALLLPTHTHTHLWHAGPFSAACTMSFEVMCQQVGAVC
jgi:hypothetical protein